MAKKKVKKKAKKRVIKGWAAAKHAVGKDIERMKTEAGRQVLKEQLLL